MLNYRNGREARVGDAVVARIRNRIFVGTVLSLNTAPELADHGREALIGFLYLQPGASPLEWGTRSPVAVTGTAGNSGARLPLAAVLYGECVLDPLDLLRADDAYAAGIESPDVTAGLLGLSVYPGTAPTAVPSGDHGGGNEGKETT